MKLKIIVAAIFIMSFYSISLYSQCSDAGVCSIGKHAHQTEGRSGSISLFVGLSFSVSLYLIGFAESFLNYWDFESTKDAIRMTGTILLIIVTVVTFISTSLAIKTQYIIMAAIVFSLLSIFLGKQDLAPDVQATIADKIFRVAVKT